MRAVLAFEKINALPIYSLSHPERLWISLTIFHRYNGLKSIIEKTLSSGLILTEAQQKYAHFIGLGLRFGLNFSAGINSNLNYIKLSVNEDIITCEITRNASSLFTSENQQRLRSFANLLSLNAEVSYKD